MRNIDTALRGYPRNAHAAHIKGHLFYELGERGAGLSYLTDWSKDYPREGLLHCPINWHLALWSLETGRRDQAWKIYRRALQLRRDLMAAPPAALLSGALVGTPVGVWGLATLRVSKEVAWHSGCSSPA